MDQKSGEKGKSLAHNFNVYRLLLSNKLFLILLLQAMLPPPHDFIQVIPSGK